MRRAKVAAIFAVCAAPLVLGWLASRERWSSGRSANYFTPASSAAFASMAISASAVIFFM